MLLYIKACSRTSPEAAIVTWLAIFLWMISKNETGSNWASRIYAATWKTVSIRWKHSIKYNGDYVKVSPSRWPWTSKNLRMHHVLANLSIFWFGLRKVMWLFTKHNSLISRRLCAWPANNLPKFIRPSWANNATQRSAFMNSSL